MKKYLPHLILLILTILIGGCVSTKVVGTYDAKNGDMIRIERGGEVSWSPLSKNQDEFQFLGILSLDAKKNDAFLTMPSAHPLLFSQLEFLDDFQTIKIKWETRFPALIKGKATVYNKRK
jgi:hypothetical protein